MECGEGKVTGMLCKAALWVFHPLLVPVWLLLALFATGIMPIYLRPAVRTYILAVVVVDTLVVPMLAMALLGIFGLVGRGAPTNRAMTLKVLVVMLCYGMCGWMLDFSPMLFMLRRMMFAAAACSLYGLVLYQWRQSSSHMIAMGGAMGVVSILMYGGYPGLLWVFFCTALCGGVTGTALLRVGSDTLAGEAAGFAGGFVIAAAVLLLG